MFRAANRQLDGAGTGLDGRAHAHPRPGGSLGQGDLHGCGVPERLRENKPSHDDLGAREPRLSRVDGRRRHRLDADRLGRLPACNQSRSRLFWRCARHRPAYQFQRDGGAAQKFHLHQRGADACRRALVGGDGDRSPRRPARLEGGAVDARQKPGGAPQFPLHRASESGTSYFVSLGGSLRRAHIRVYLWRAAGAGGTAGVRILRLAARSIRRRDDGFRDHCGGHRSGGGDAPRSNGDAALLRLQHGGLLPPLARDGQTDSAPAENFPRQLVPQGRRWQVPLARVRRKRAGAEVDSRACPGQGESSGNARRLGAYSGWPHPRWPGSLSQHDGRAATSQPC